MITVNPTLQSETMLSIYRPIYSLYNAQKFSLSETGSLTRGFIGYRSTEKFLWLQESPCVGLQKKQKAVLSLHKLFKIHQLILLQRSKKIEIS